MRFEHSICRYSEDDLIRRVFAVMAFPAPPTGGARQCAEAIVKAGDLIAGMIGTASTHLAHVREQQARMVALMEMLDTPKIEPTRDQVEDDKQVGQSLCVLSKTMRVGVEIYAGIGAIYRRADRDTLISQVAPISGPGMDQRRDYLLSVIEKTRDTMEMTLS